MDLLSPEIAAYLDALVPPRPQALPRYRDPNILR
jgi:hypothetical protein